MTSRPPIRVEFTPHFLKILKRLKKKYPNIAADLRQVTDRLERGETPGDQVKAARHPVYKARLQSSDARKGKSGGYRVIYYIKTPEHVILLIMYLKSEQTDISADEIRRLIEEFQAG